MATTTTEHHIAASEFVAATTINVNVFKQELLDDAGVAQEPYLVKQIDNVVTVYWTGVTVTQATLDAVDAAAAAHVGGEYAAMTQREEMAGGTTETAPSDSDVDCVSLDSGLLRAGKYDIDWYLEHKVDDVTAQSRVLFWLGKNSGSLSQRATDSGQLLNYASFSGKLPLTIKDGETIQMKLTIKRSTSGSGNAIAQRGRLFLNRVDD